MLDGNAFGKGSSGDDVSGASELLTWRILTFHDGPRGKLCHRYGLSGRHGLSRKYRSSGRHSECPAMVGAEPNKMRLGNLARASLSVMQAGEPLANDSPIIIATARTGMMRIVIAKANFDPNEKPPRVASTAGALNGDGGSHQNRCSFDRNNAVGRGLVPLL